MLTRQEAHELLWAGTPESLTADFETMRRNVLLRGKSMTVDQVIEFLDSCQRMFGPQTRPQEPAYYDRMLI